MAILKEIAWHLQICNSFFYQVSKSWPMGIFFLLSTVQEPVDCKKNLVKRHHNLHCTIESSLSLNHVSCSKLVKCGLILLRSEPSPTLCPFVRKRIGVEKVFRTSNTFRQHNDFLLFLMYNKCSSTDFNYFSLSFTYSLLHHSACSLFSFSLTHSSFLHRVATLLPLKAMHLQAYLLIHHNLFITL